MAKFRKKPVEIEAEQYNGYAVKGICNTVECSLIKYPHVHTIHKGQHVRVEKGDWIIPEPDGKHFYPCKPDIFEDTYEAI